MGPERKSRIPDEEANLITAYHEGGHTIVAHYTQDAHPLHKVHSRFSLISVIRTNHRTRFTYL
jgi:hypothetical protein